MLGNTECGLCKYTGGQCVRTLMQTEIDFNLALMRGALADVETHSHDDARANRGRIIISRIENASSILEGNLNKIVPCKERSDCI